MAGPYDPPVIRLRGREINPVGDPIVVNHEDINIIVKNGGIQGPTGDEGTIWLYGDFPPNNVDGRDGDYYFQITTGDIFIKENGDWGDPKATIAAPPSIESIIVTYEAASPININRVVALLPSGQIQHADKDDPMADQLDIIGISKTSGSAGDNVQIITYGKLYGAAFGAVSDNLFLGNNGLMTNVAPDIGIWINIGIQMESSVFFINIGEPILIT